MIKKENIISTFLTIPFRCIANFENSNESSHKKAVEEIIFLIKEPGVCYFQKEKESPRNIFKDIIIAIENKRSF